MLGGEEMGQAGGIVITNAHMMICRDFCMAVKLERYGAGQVVIRQGDPGDSFAMILRGGMIVSGKWGVQR